MRQSPLLGLKRQDIHQIASPLRPKFQTASRLRFDDSLAIDIGERVAGKCSTLVDRLCITALLPERHGGFGSPHVLTAGINLTFIKGVGS